MPKVINTERLELIVRAIKKYPDGIGSKELVSLLKETYSKRTLQRHLSQLVTKGILTRIGIGPSSRYIVPSSENKAIEFSHLQDGLSIEDIPLSPESIKIQQYVNQPRQKRVPKGYQLQFLEEYSPNRTHYLSKELRDQLNSIGTAGEPDRPAGTFARNILGRLLIDLSWSSSRLEGNTYSRLDTEKLIEFGQTADGKDALETQMILNHKAAIEFLINEAENLEISHFTIYSLHALLSDGLLADLSTLGIIRQRAVEIGGSVYRPIAIPQRLKEIFEIILTMAAEIEDPFEQSFFLMTHLPYLQPFIDVNKRVSRLAANIPLIKHNLCPLSFIDVPERIYIEATLGVYELTQIDLLRDVFVWAYDRSCQQYLAIRQELVPPDPFRLRYRTQLAETIKSVFKKYQQPNEKIIVGAIPYSIPNRDQKKFVELVIEEFNSMHEGNAIRYGIHPSDFRKWAELIEDN
jgi:Fic family protein